MLTTESQIMNIRNTVGLIVFIGLGCLLFADGANANPFDALRKVNKYLNVKIHYRLGRIYQTQGKLDDAITEFQKVIEIDPKNADAYGYLGGVFQEEGKLEKAIKKQSRSILTICQGIAV